MATEPPADKPGLLTGLWSAIESTVVSVTAKLSSKPAEPAPATLPPARPGSPVRTVETSSAPARPAAAPVSPVRTVEATPARAAGPPAGAPSPVRTIEAPAEAPQKAATPATDQAEKPAGSGASLVTASLEKLRSAVEPVLSSIWRKPPPTVAEPATESSPAAAESPVVVASLPAGDAPAVPIIGPDTIPAGATGDSAAKPAEPPPGSAVDSKKGSAAQLFGGLKGPSGQPTRVIGTYSKGCLAGAHELAANGPGWQAMRPSRNRQWGHPALIRFVEQLASDATQKDGFPGLLVGDLSQPRGGPMTFGHASHQVGLDVDVWYLPMPERQLSAEERDRMPMPTVLVNPTNVDPNLFTAKHAQVVRRAAGYSNVDRVLVHPAVKKALCESTEGDRSVLHKIRPFWGHDDHFHVRLSCPPDSVGCQPTPAAPADEGCGKELDHWLAIAARTPTPQPPSAVPNLAPDLAAEQPKPISASAKVGIDALPAQCKIVQAAPAAQTAQR